MTTQAAVSTRRFESLPGLMVVLLIAGVSVLIAEVVSGTSPLLWAVVIGAFTAGQVRRGPAFRAGVEYGSKDLLRAGVALLGFQVSLEQVAAVGPSGLAIATATLAVTLGGTYLLGRHFRVREDAASLIAIGTAVCGASAIAAGAATLRLREEAAGYSIAVITLFGCAAMVVLPLAAGLIGLSDEQAGVWAGASIHEVGQVAVAGAAISPTALQVATLVKLARVALLLPALIGARLLTTKPAGAESRSKQSALPGFVLAFIAFVVLRSILPLSAEVIDLMRWLSVVLLACGLAAVGLRIDVRDVLARGWRGLALGGAATLLACGTSLALVLLLVP